MFCKHKWSLVSDKTSESQLEHAANNGLSITKANTSVLERVNIQIIQCERCGKVKRYVTTI